MFQGIHNTTEDVVFAQAAEIFDSISQEGGGTKNRICTCPQCRQDTVCYVLNRTAPRYVISNRGVARVEQTTIERQQYIADITAMIWEGLRQVQHNLRPTAHGQSGQEQQENAGPVFNFPTIVGRLLSGSNFEPLSGITVELLRDGKLVRVWDQNWQNPYNLVANTAGVFAFWPYPVSAEEAGERSSFDFSVRVEAAGFETLNHFFTLPVISEDQWVKSYSMARTFKLPDLYLFPPGGNEHIYIDEPD